MEGENDIDGFESGDVILFSGETSLHKRLQSHLKSPWSGAGILLRYPSLGELVVFESTKLSVCNDIETGKILYGVQLVSLAERVEKFQGRVCIRRIFPVLSPQHVELLLAFYKEIKGTPYNDSKYYIVRAKHRKNRISDLSKFYCSELVAEAYQRIGILSSPPEGPTSNNYIPTDFTTQGIFLKLKENFKLGHEIYISP